jgi:RNA polymerase sigma-70 factor (ECF subfamily)
MTAAHHELADAELLAAHRDGDPDAFGVLFTRHRDRLWAVALRTTGNPEDAADALQEAMISAYRRADSFRGDALVTTWLHRVVVNACLDRLRRNKVRAAQPLPDDLEEYAARGAVAGAPPSTADAADPEAQALAADRRRTVIAALEQLPPDQRAAVVLVDLEGHRVEDAARILDCPPGTVKSRCSRARARLAILLRDAGIAGTAGPAGASDQESPRITQPINQPTNQPTTRPTTEPQGGART